MGVNEVEWATPSGLRRRRRLAVVTEAPRSGIANGLGPSKTSGEGGARGYKVINYKVPS
jgi:hypothetical protein